MTPDLLQALFTSLPNFAFASLGFFLGWRVYLDMTRRLDRLIDAVLAICGDVETPQVVEARPPDKPSRA